MTAQPPSLEPENLPSESLRPIVINLKKKRKRRYSRGLSDFQRTTRGLSKVSASMARSFYKGADEFRKVSDKSARKKRDGALRDLGLNIAKALSESLSASSRIPQDIAKTLDTRSMRRSSRRQIRVLSRFNRVLRLH